MSKFILILKGWLLRIDIAKRKNIMAIHTTESDARARVGKALCYAKGPKIRSTFENYKIIGWNRILICEIVGGKVYKPEHTMFTQPEGEEAIIGFHSNKGAQNYANVLATIDNEQDKNSFTMLVLDFKEDFRLVHTCATKVVTVEVTDEFIGKCSDPRIPVGYEGSSFKFERKVILSSAIAGQVYALEKAPFGGLIFRELLPCEICNEES